MARITEIAIDGLSQPVWSAYGFSNRKDAILYFLNGLLAYAAVPTADQMSVLLQRTEDRLPAETHPTWIVGVAQLYASPESMMPHIHAGLQQGSAGCSYQNDIRLHDSNYLDIARVALPKFSRNESK